MNERLDINNLFGDRHENEDVVNPNIFQGDNNSCAVRAQEIVMRDYGIIVPQHTLIDFAEDKGWYDDGTPMGDVGNILDAYGIETKRTEGNTIEDIMSELSLGHRVIIGVDSGELWETGFIGKAIETLEDFFGDESGADHALIVSAINVNPDDPKDISVVLTDSGTGKVKEYSIDEFTDAWSDANCFMVSTTNPAPYQYNTEDNVMEPSNFMTEYVVDRFIEDNSFTLPITDDDYNPYYDTDGLDFSIYEDFELSPLNPYSDADYDPSTTPHSAADDMFISVM